MDFKTKWYSPENKPLEIPTFQDLQNVTGQAFDDFGNYVGKKEMPKQQLVIDKLTQRQYYAPEEYSEDAIRYGKAKIDESFKPKDWYGMTQIKPNYKFMEHISAGYISTLKSLIKPIAELPTKIVYAGAVGLNAISRGNFQSAETLYRSSMKNWEQTLDKAGLGADPELQDMLTVKIGSIAGQTASSLLMAAAVSSVGGLPAVAAVFGSQQFADVMEEGLAKGLSHKKAVSVAFQAAVAEGGLEAVGFRLWSGAASMNKSFRNIALGFLWEGAQEGSQQIAESAITNFYGLREQDLYEIMAEVALSALVGGLVGGVGAWLSGQVEQRNIALKKEIGMTEKGNIVTPNTEKKEKGVMLKPSKEAEKQFIAQEIEDAKRTGDNKLYNTIKHIANTHGITEENVIDKLYPVCRKMVEDGATLDNLLDIIGQQVVAYKSQLDGNQIDKEANDKAVEQIKLVTDPNRVEEWREGRKSELEKAGVSKRDARIATKNFARTISNLSQRLGFDITKKYDVSFEKRAPMSETLKGIKEREEGDISFNFGANAEEEVFIPFQEGLKTQTELLEAKRSIEQGLRAQKSAPRSTLLSLLRRVGANYSAANRIDKEAYKNAGIRNNKSGIGDELAFFLRDNGFMSFDDPQTYEDKSRLEDEAADLIDRALSGEKIYSIENQALADEVAMAEESREQAEQELRNINIDLTRGQISFLGKVAKIALGETFDFTTLEHEFFHFIDRVVLDAAKEGNVEAQKLVKKRDEIIKKAKAELKKRGIKDMPIDEEILASAYEKWLWQGGKSEDAYEQRLFNAIREFFREVYDTVKGLMGIRITPEADAYFRAMTGEGKITPTINVDSFTDLESLLQSLPKEQAKDIFRKVIYDKRVTALSDKVIPIKEKMSRLRKGGQSFWDALKENPKEYNEFAKIAKESERLQLEVAKELVKSAPDTLFQEDIKYDKNSKADTNSPEFKKWFGDSKVVDENGKPLVVYHGTKSYFDTFRPSKDGALGQGMYFAASQEYARGVGKNVMPVYLSIKNPYIADGPITGNAEKFTNKLKKQGYDGIINPANGFYVAFEPTQIKSVYNRGTFDTESPNIYYQQETQDQLFRNDQATKEGNKVLDKAPTNEQVEKELATIRSGRVVESEPKRGFGLAESIGDFVLTVRQRVGTIDKRLKYAFDKLDFNEKMYESKYGKNVVGYIKKYRKLDDTKKRELDYLILNKQDERIREFVRQNDMLEEYNQARTLLDNLYAEGNKAGMDMGFLQEYFPTKVVDPEGLITYLKGTDKWTEIERALAEIDPNNQMSIEDRANAINNILRGYNRADPISKQGFQNERLIFHKTPEMMKFYAPSDEALMRYVSGMSSALAIRNAFNVKNAFNAEESIGGVVQELIKSGQITYKEEAFIRKMLKARLNYARTAPIVALLKNFGYLGTMNNITSAVTQIGDLYANFYKYNFGTAMKALFGKREITKEDLHIDSIWEEFADAGWTGIAVNKLFSAIGLNKFDKFGKETAINGAWIDLKTRLKNNDISLLEDLSAAFGSRSKQVMEDIKNNNITEDVKLLIWTQLADTQPLGKSGVPVGYLNNPHGRIIYQLKTYTINQLSLFYADGIYKINKGLATKNKKLFLQGVGNTAKLALLLTIFNAGADALKNLIMGRKIDISDTLLSNMLWNIGVSKYTFYRGQRDGYARALLENYLLPPQISMGDDAYMDIKKIATGKRKPSDTIAVTYVPFGRMWYWWFGGGRTQEKKKGNKPFEVEL